MSLYAFANGDPVNRFDPDGQFGKDLNGNPYPSYNPDPRLYGEITEYRDPGAGLGFEGGRGFARGLLDTLKGLGSIILDPVQAYQNFQRIREPLTPYGSGVDNFFLSTEMKLQSPYGRGSLMGEVVVMRGLSVAGPTVSGLRAGLTENMTLRFTQTTASPWFSSEGNFSGLTISDVAAKLRAGTLTLRMSVRSRLPSPS